MQLTRSRLSRGLTSGFITAGIVLGVGLVANLRVAAAPSKGERAASGKNTNDQAEDEGEEGESGDEVARIQRGPAGAKKGERAGIAVRASSAFSAYSDSDSVHVLSPTIAGSASDEVAGWSVNGRYLVDAVSAASVDVVSAASSNWFEIRHVGSLATEVKRGSVGVTLGGGVSREPDYLSLGGGGTVSIELMDKNVTPFVGASYGHDDVGRTGMPKAYWSTLQKVGLQAGATFVVGRSTIASLSGDLIVERGYLGKPYRYVPLFAPGTGALVPHGASVDLVNQLRIDQRPSDAVPDARDRYAISGRIAHRFASSTLRLDQRVYRDSWGLMASTTDSRYTVDLGPRVAIWPHVRFHAQRGISFWQRAYEAVAVGDGTLAIPRFRTGDRELGPMQTVTAGGGIKLLLGDLRSPWALTLQMEGISTQFDDALYIKSRRAVYANMLLDVGFD